MLLDRFGDVSDMLGWRRLRRLSWLTRFLRFELAIVLLIIRLDVRRDRFTPRCCFQLPPCSSRLLSKAASSVSFLFFFLCSFARWRMLFWCSKSVRPVVPDLPVNWPVLLSCSWPA